VTPTVLLIHGSSGGYGADRQLLVLASGLDRDRFSPLVVLPEQGELVGRLEEAGVEVHIEPLAVLKRDLLRGRRALRTRRLFDRNVRELGALARDRGAEIVHSNTSILLCGQAVADSAGAAHVISIREIYSHTGGRAGALLWPLLKRRFLRADALACVSHAVADQFAGSPRTFVLYDAVPRELALPERDAARRELGLRDDRFVAAVVGRISDWKGQDVFLRALAEPSLTEICALGVIAGDAAPGQERFERRLETLCADLGLGDRLRLLGFRDDVETVLGAADVLVVPSAYQEPLPNVALEGAAAGLPVVCTTTGGQGEIIRDGVTGRLVPPGDHRALAAVLRELADDRDGARGLGEAAASDVRERFSRERMLAEIEGCYEGLLKKPRRPATLHGPWGGSKPRMMSVVLPIRNEETHLAQQLAALSAQTYQGAWELVVVDNGSTDRSLEIVEAWRGRLPPLRVVDASDVRGLNYARNRGAEAAEGDLLAFGDADDEAAPGWLESLAAAAASADLVGGPLDDDALNDGSTAGWIPRERLTALPRAYGFLPYVPGGNCAVWTRLARELRWNDAYVVGGSDVEFSWRAQLAGARLGFARDAVMRRRYPSSLGELARKYFGYGLAGPLVYREFRTAGMPRSDAGEALREWAWLLRGALRAASSRQFRGNWLRVAAKRSGRLVGSLARRVLYL
jgi:glycosyltransferase involved in cell wall biosynthesis